MAGQAIRPPLETMDWSATKLDPQRLTTKLNISKANRLGRTHGPLLGT